MLGIRQRVWRETVRLLSTTRSDRLMQAMLNVQKTRARIEEVQDGMLHFAALPTRQDVRRLQRQVDALRRRAAQLDLIVAELEQAADQAGRTGHGT